MTNPFSSPMDISSGDVAGNVSSADRSMADEMLGGVKLREFDNVKNYKRSRFDEVENYKQVGHVGSGGYGNCLLLQKRSNLSLRVCKVQKRPKSVLEPLEVEILRDILYDHPRIVRLHDAIMHTHTMQLYFDFYPGGDLYKLMVRYFEEWQAVPESFIWHCFLQISEGLAYLHHGYDRRTLDGLPPASEWQTIIHGDIKPENIFLGPPTPETHGYPSLVLGDFGLATIDEIPVAGTWMWQPPELPMTSTKADVWALGSVIHALAHEGQPPLRTRPADIDRSDFYRWPAAREPMSLLGDYSTELHNLVVHGTLEFDPRARYSSLEVLRCIAIEVELGVASDMAWEPLLDTTAKAKTYDENGVTENATVSSEGCTGGFGPTSLQELDPMPYCDPATVVSEERPLGVDSSLQELEPMAYCDPMEYAACY